MFDRSFLPDADFEFVVLGDTHFVSRPDAYAPKDSQDPRFARLWSARAEWALRLAASLKTSFIVHLGDLAQEYPGMLDTSFLNDEEKARVASLAQVLSSVREEALERIERCGVNPHYVAGNMDIGDKPNPTMPSERVTSDSLAKWHRHFGRSWYSFDEGAAHCVVLNSQIINGSLPQAEEQKRWFENELLEHRGERIFVFLHVPPFLVDEHEPGFGVYDNIDEPGRGWLLGLLRQHKVELVFSGHTHFAMFNRLGETRLYVVPSTTTSRTGFYEVFSVNPPEQGRNDTAKLGFYLVRVYQSGCSVHFIRTTGATDPESSTGSALRLVTRLSHQLPRSPLGLYLRVPLTHMTDGVVAWPDVIRKRVRNDYPLLAFLELGARSVRVPASDLEDNLQRWQLKVLREEGVEIIAVWIWSDGFRLADTVKQYKDQIDAFEVQVPGTFWPGASCCQVIEQCGMELGIPVTLAPLLPLERVAGKFHPRARIGYRLLELPELNRRLSHTGTQVDRVICHIEPHVSPWNTFSEFDRLRPLSHIGSFDFVVQLSGTDEQVQAVRAAEAVFASACRDARVFLDPVVDLDRTSDVSFGLLDRLFNPRPAFQVVRCLNTILFASAEKFERLADATLQGGMALGIKSRRRLLWLLLPDKKMAVTARTLDNLLGEGREITYFDLTAGTSRVLHAKREFGEALANIETPVLLTSTVLP